MNSQRDPNGKRSIDLISSVTIAVIFIVILLLVVFTASAYQFSAQHHDTADNERAVLSYVVNAVKDSGGSEGTHITTRDYNGSSGLSIRETGSQYEQRFYLRDGKLLQEYGLADGNIDPRNAVEIGKTKEFKASFINDDLLELKTDTGISYVHIAQ